MAYIEGNKYLALDGVDSLPVTSKRCSKVGVVAIWGCSIALLSFVCLSISSATLRKTSAADSTNLIGLSRSLRTPVGQTIPRTGDAVVPRGVYCHDCGALRKFAMNQIVANKLGIQGDPRDISRDISMKAEISEAEEIRNVRREAEAEAERLANATKLKAEDMAGVTAPLGFFDPVGFSTDCSTGKLLFYREVELKHGRVGMLAALGFLVGEQFHPLFGGNVDAPSYIAFQQTPLQKFWPAVLLAISIPEVFSVFTFKSPFGMNIVDNMWQINEDHMPGDLGFDPLGLKPTNPAELKEMQTKELNNGRLAMIAAAGMIAQELASGKKLF